MHKRVVREYHWSYWRFGRLNVDQEPIFHEETARAEVACGGHFLLKNGHIAALDLMARALQPWLAQHWAGRLLLAGDEPEFNAYCQSFSWPRRPFVLPQQHDTAAMACHLLAEVAVPLLEPQGLDVLHVAVRRPSEPPAVAYQAHLPGYRQPELRVQHLDLNPPAVRQNGIVYP